MGRLEISSFNVSKYSLKESVTIFWELEYSSIWDSIFSLKILYCPSICFFNFLSSSLNALWWSQIVKEVSLNCCHILSLTSYNLSLTSFISTFLSKSFTSSSSLKDWISLSNLVLSCANPSFKVLTFASITLKVLPIHPKSGTMDFLTSCISSLIDCKSTS